MTESTKSIFCFIISILGLISGCFCTCSKQSQTIIARVNGEAITEKEFIAALPKGFTSDSTESNYRRSLIDNLIVKKLFIQEAKALGLEDQVDAQLEYEKKHRLIQALYDDVVTKNLKITEKDIQDMLTQISTEVHLKVIVMPNESIAQIVNEGISKGIPFESLAVKYSQDESAVEGGDIGWLPVYYLEESLRNAVANMKENEISSLIRSADEYKIIKLIEKRISKESLSERKTNARMLVEQEKHRQLVSAYLEKLSQRLEFNPEGLRLFYKHPDSFSEAERETWVAKKDNRKVVYAKNLFHIAREFPRIIDTALKSYAIKRAIEEDVMYEDALNRNLDKLPEIQKEFEQRKKDLLYQKLYAMQITQTLKVTDKEIEDYYNANKEKYLPNKVSDVAPLIKNELLEQKRQERYMNYVQELKAKSKIEIDEKRLMNAGKKR
ncbi:MAG: peptidylprolyl isomerase [candidate division WOR-3 bacterium]|nr:peptidylprolyl isomerase [candidate division WOR-3 bacterium]